MTALLFWAATSAILYTYIGYPLLLVLLNSFSWKPKKHQGCGTALPSVSVLIAAYNEEGCIGAKVANTLALDYPEGLLEVVVASDGSTDGTARIVREMAATDKRVRLLEFPRTGKSGVLTKAVSRIASDIIMFSDANTECEASALRRIVSHFGDPLTGCVCGRLIYRNPGGTVSGDGEGFYWRYETVLKRLESRLGCVSGANGAIYAIRRALFEPLPAGTINDDFVISMRVVEKGYGCVYEEQALAYEDVASSVGGEFRRHVRDGAGHYIAMWHLSGLLNPFLGMRAFVYWSHRVLRWSAPFILPATFVLNALLFHQWFYRGIFAFQAAFYGAAVMGLVVINRNLPFFIYVPFYFCSLNLALLVGFFKAVSGRQKMTWEKAGRA